MFALFSIVQQLFLFGEFVFVGGICKIWCLNTPGQAEEGKFLSPPLTILA